MSMESLKEVMVDLLRDLYHAEKQLVAALPKLEKAASSRELKTAFADHLKQTREHVRRLESAFAALELKPSAKLCHGMKGLVEEGKEVISEKRSGNPDAVDAALIAAAQKVEHYEITAYGTLATFATQLGREDVADLFKQTLGEEETADKLLSEIAEGAINARAASGPDDEAEVANGRPRRAPRKTGRRTAAR
ncbi:MAG: ferritin-like domain-containing protein [Phycisphaerales bacterium]|nr:ferritin-like domain-containing protein [Phycisphaerales bacterium]